MRRGWETQRHLGFPKRKSLANVFLLFISLFLIPPLSSCHFLAVKMKSCHLCVHNNGGLCRPHGSCSLIYFNSFYIEPNDLICCFWWRAFNMQGGSQAPLPKKLWAQLLLKLVPSFEGYAAARGGGRDIFSHRYAPSPTDPLWLQKYKIRLIWVTLLFLLLFSPLFKPLFPCLPTWLQSQILLAPLFFQASLEPGKVWDFFFLISNLPSFFGWVACKDSPFLRYSSLENSGKTQQSSCFTFQHWV